MLARSIAVVCLPLLLSACGSDEPEEGPPPNVILISLDTLRAGHMSMYGYERDTTPNLARFAEGATVYENAVASSCWTLISHISMLSGLYPEQHGVINAQLALSPETPLLADRLYEEGYQTLAIFKEGWIHERFGIDRGFEVFRNHEDAHEAGPNLFEELDKLQPNRPYFLFLHLFDIHSKKIEGPEDPFYDPPAPWDEKFITDARTRLADVDFSSARLKKQDALTPEELEGLIGIYDGGVAWVDSLLGEWFADMEERGLLENTLVVITADHGEALGQRGRIKGHGSMWQDGLHVPLLVRYPDGYLAGERVEEIVSHVDIYPTVLDCLGLEADPRMPGYSLRGEWPATRVVRSAKPPHFARIRWPYKLFGAQVARTFFNLEKDPGEVDGFKSREAEEQIEAAFEEEFAGREWVHFNTITAGLSDRQIANELAALGYAGELGLEDEDDDGPDGPDDDEAGPDGE